MGLFDKLNNSQPVNEIKNFVQPKTGTETVVIERLPESLDELKAMPEAAMETPFQTAALAVCALCAYGADKEIGGEMLNFLRGPKGPLSTYDISFLKDRFTDGQYYVPFSYFKGATPENDYTPTKPYTLDLTAGTYAYGNEGYAKLDLVSGGADSPRQIVLRRGGDGKWYLWDQFIMVGIRQPKSKNPWA